MTKQEHMRIVMALRREEAACHAQWRDLRDDGKYDEADRWREAAGVLSETMWDYYEKEVVRRG